MRNIKIFTDLSNYTCSEKQGILKLKRGCISSKGICLVSDCIKCDDCLYSFSFGDSVIEGSEYKNSTLKEEVFEIDFFDEFNIDDFINYMSSDSSDYRAFDVKNSIIVRLSHDDLEKYDRLKSDDYIDRFDLEEEVKNLQENITGFQKIIRKFKGIK